MMFHNGHRSFQSPLSLISFCHLICAPGNPLIMWSLPAAYVQSTEHKNMSSKGVQITFWCHSWSGFQRFSGKTFENPWKPLKTIWKPLKTTWKPLKTRSGRDGFQWFSDGFQMVFRGFQWFSKVFRGFQGFSDGFQGFSDGFQGFWTF